MTTRNTSIDVSKGICMLLVIWNHTVSALYNTGDFFILFNKMFITFFMAAFFIFSGYFSREKDFFELIRNNTHKLIKPFIIFYILGFIFSFISTKINGIALHNEFHWSNIFNCFLSKPFSNGALWFLLVLFEAQLIFQVIFRIKKDYLAFLYICLCACIGYLLALSNYRLPIYLDTAFSCIPFIYIGYLSSKWKIFLIPINKRVKHGIILFCSILLFFLKEHYWGMLGNNIHGNILVAYTTGTIGTVMILCISSLLKENRILQYIGKNSIIPLCTHFFLIKPTYIGLNFFTSLNENIKGIICFLLVCLFSYMLIKLINKHIPYIVGKK